MSELIWYQGTQEIGRGYAHSRPLTILVDPVDDTGGTVQVQFQKFDGTWEAPQDFIFDTFGPQRVGMESVFGFRIVATGNARFAFRRE